MVNFIYLSVCHLLGDYYLQTDKLAKCKNAIIDSNCNACKRCKSNSNYNILYLIFHILIYCIPFLTIFFFVEWYFAFLIIGILLLSHFCIDLFTCYINSRIKKSLSFILDQFLHIICISIISNLFNFNFYIFNICLLDYFKYVKILFAALCLLVPSSVLVNKLFEDLYPDTSAKAIFEIGSIIGMAERIIIFILSCFNQFAVIAIIITLKTWARSADLKENNACFRNKYLLGTLLSFSLALLVYIVYIKI